MKKAVSEALGWTLVHFLWEGVIIAALLAMLLAVVRSARIRYAVGCAAMLAMLVSFAVTLFHFLPTSNGGAGTLVPVNLLPLRRLPDGNGADSGLPNLTLLIPWLGPIWLLGVSLFYLRHAAGWVSLYGLRRRGAFQAPDSWQRAVTRLAVELRVSRPVVLLESLLADTPVVLGHFRPVILVPLGFLSGLPTDQVEAILLHELAHIRRSDYLVNACQRLMEGLLFYHPAAWWISRVIRSERENCCDDMVVLLRGDAHGYALALTSLEQNRLRQQWPTRETAMAATGGNLMKRIKRLLYPKGPSGIWAPTLAAAVLMAGSAMALAAWQVNANPGLASLQSDQKAGTWQKWLNEDVVYIISDEEKAAFEHLTTDEERQQFVAHFWARRDPTPGTPENEFKEEHYRRIAYANDHWPWQVPGWKTGRGMIYIKYGPPDEIDSHPAGGSYERPAAEGGGTVMTYPFEDWRYSHFAGVGSLTVEFIDPTKTGEFRMTLDPNEKYKKP
jgi:GWxTD domain-containing protein